ncbi:MAG: hypothetical protein Harvfovirus80_2 [Harvfovirus sp.]|uniref:Zn-dependent peptidase n=1 Tax=Harvfovirus sp. TaxID=2487768 RepID=A0A3G5A995_9VIRU|nr:MAG: hypothetical protein Harvfovirus80_2 [Harvfovirus sp.]
MDHRVYREILENGMDMLLIPFEKAVTMTVAVGIFVKVGSRYETSERNGMSHFLEHMMFKGTKKYPKNKISELLDGVGAIYNAETSYESTNYYIYGHKNDLDLFIDIMCDIYMNPLFREDDIIIERGVVVEELNMYRDDPQDIIQDMLHKTMCGNSGLGMNIIGTKENILSFNGRDLEDFREEFYVPHRTVFVVSGNFSKERVGENIRKQLGTVRASLSQVECPIYHTERQKKPQINVREQNSMAQTNIIIAFRSGSKDSKYVDVYEIIAGLLSSGSSSRLYDLLRNKLGATYFNHAQNHAFEKEGIFTIHMGVDNKRVDEVLGRVLQEIHGLRRAEIITKKELDKVKRIKITAFSLALQTPVDFMSYYGMQELNYYVGCDKLDERPIDIASRIKNFESITIEDVYVAMRELFCRKNLNIIIYGTPPVKI